MSLIYAILRCFHFQTPVATSRYIYPIVIGLAVLILAHFTYLLSFTLGSFPYGYHTKFVLTLALIHNAIWILWSLSFRLPLPSFSLGSTTFQMPAAYPPNDPRQSVPETANTPAILVLLTTLAMSFELLDFPPILRIVDAHSVWHACTIPLAVAWWSFFYADAIEFEGTLLGVRGAGVGVGMDEKMPLSERLSNGLAGSRPKSPATPHTTGESSDRLTATVYPTRSRSPGKDRED